MFVNMGFKSVLPEKLENYKNIYNASLNNIINNIVNSLTFSDFFCLLTILNIIFS